MDNLFKLWLATLNIPKRDKIYIKNYCKSIEEVKSILNLNKSYLPNNIKTGRLIECYENVIKNNLLEYMEKEKINLIFEEDKDYPQKLRDCSNAPFALFYKGNIKELNNKKSIAVVGSRDCTKYGEDVTTCIIEELKNYNINIVSGMARGIDAVAHSSALKNNINTVAVLGSVVDVIYPRENTKLYNNIIEAGGCILSEYPLGASALKRNFPIRNRIISGLSEIILVTEAGSRSGTMITVGAALDQGKDIVAVPGSIFSKTSAGTNALIRDGATIFTNVEDMLYLGNISEGIIDNNSKINKNKNFLKEILHLIDDNPIHIDDLVERTNIDIKQLYKLLFELQVKEEILCLSGNFYVKINKAL